MNRALCSEILLAGMLCAVSAEAYDTRFIYVDTFDDAENGSDYGLNSILPKRQLYGPWTNTVWERRDGSWFNKGVSHPWYSQVNHPWTEDKLSFHVEYSAVELRKRIWPGPAAQYVVAFSTNPVKGESSSSNWTSIMLDRESEKRGYVTQTELGFLIRSYGGVGVYQNGHLKPVSGGPVPAAESYDVRLELSPGQLMAMVNGVQLTAALDEPLPPPTSGAHLYLGAYIPPGSSHVSWFDDLVVSTQYGTGNGHVEKYGYYWTYSPSFGHHFSEVKHYTNLNFVALSSPAELNSDELAQHCQGKRCAVQVRWQFWPYSRSDRRCGELRADWQELWADYAAEIQTNEDLVGALYIADEPYWAVCTNLSDYEKVLSGVKADVPDIPVLAVFAYPTIDPDEDFYNPGTPFFRDPNVNGLDWVGFDRYVYPDGFAQIESDLARLKELSPGRSVFLVPQTCRRSSCGGGSPPTDAEVAEINWLFYDLAIADPSVVGIWNFGLWSHSCPAEMPLTLEVQQLIGRAIVGRKTTP